MRNCVCSVHVYVSVQAHMHYISVYYYLKTILLGVQLPCSIVVVLLNKFYMHWFYLLTADHAHVDTYIYVHSGRIEPWTSLFTVSRSLKTQTIEQAHISTAIAITSHDNNNGKNILDLSWCFLWHKSLLPVDPIESEVVVVAGTGGEADGRTTRSSDKNCEESS